MLRWNILQYLKKMLRKYFSSNERLEIFLTCFCNILCYVGRKRRPIIREKSKYLSNIFGFSFTKKCIKPKSERHLPGCPYKSLNLKWYLDPFWKFCNFTAIFKKIKKRSSQSSWDTTRKKRAHEILLEWHLNFYWNCASTPWFLQERHVGIYGQKCNIVLFRGVEYENFCVTP